MAYRGVLSGQDNVRSIVAAKMHIKIHGSHPLGNFFGRSGMVLIFTSGPGLVPFYLLPGHKVHLRRWIAGRDTEPAIKTKNSCAAARLRV